MTFTKNAVALLAPLPLIGCVTTGHDQADLKAAIVGPEWIVEDIAGRGVIDDARATLRFGNDGRVDGDTSCNRYFGEYTVKESEIQFRNSGVTKRACAPAVMDQESRFLAVFNAVDRYRVDDGTGTLVLSHAHRNIDHGTPLWPDARDDHLSLCRRVKRRGALSYKRHCQNYPFGSFNRHEHRSVGQRSAICRRGLGMVDQGNDARHAFAPCSRGNGGFGPRAILYRGEDLTVRDVKPRDGIVLI